MLFMDASISEQCEVAYLIVKAYSPDLSLGNLAHSFPLKRAFRFHSDDEVNEAMPDSLENQPQSFYSEDIDLVSKQWDTGYNA
ncbi:hypothetical protein TNCV_1297601 [Trichonephila clavipes]|nr:hypothetical protein TNCV_1297601 [Trichonephila clavipes]